MDIPILTDGGSQAKQTSFYEYLIRFNQAFADRKLLMTFSAAKFEPEKMDFLLNLTSDYFLKTYALWY